MSRVIRKIISTPLAVPPLGPYSQAVQANNTLYLAGQIGMTTDMVLVEGIEGQTRLALENMGHILKAAGASFNNVVKVTVLLSDMSNFQTMNSVYAEFFTKNFPARAAYQVSVLPKNALIEIEAVAEVGEIVDA